MSFKYIRVDAVVIDGEDLRNFVSSNGNKYSGQIKVPTNRGHVQIRVHLTGEYGQMARFNLTYKGKKFFSIDQKLITNKKNYCNFHRQKVKIPF